MSRYSLSSIMRREEFGSRKYHGDVMANVKPQPAEGSNEMVERVAAALGIAHAKRSTFPFSEHSLREFARAAITAMREPTDAMLCGHGVYPSCHTCGGGYEQWHAMIDTALIGGPPSTDDKPKT